MDSAVFPGGRRQQAISGQIKKDISDRDGIGASAFRNKGTRYPAFRRQNRNIEQRMNHCWEFFADTHMTTASSHISVNRIITDFFRKSNCNT